MKISFAGMEANVASASALFPHSQSTSSERFLGFFSQSPPENSTGDELDEHDVFWNGDDLYDHCRSPNRVLHQEMPPHNGVVGFRRPESYGILAALPEDDKKRTPGQMRPFLHRKASIPAMVPTIPKPQNSSEYSSLSIPSGKSAPVNVPVMPKAIGGDRRRSVEIFLEDDDGDEDEEMLPPHEIVARSWARKSPLITFSVLEGAGRTLKGRDLRQVRNAVFRRTGFLD